MENSLSSGAEKFSHLIDKTKRFVGHLNKQENEIKLLQREILRLEREKIAILELVSTLNTNAENLQQANSELESRVEKLLYSIEDLSPYF